MPLPLLLRPSIRESVLVSRGLSQCSRSCPPMSNSGAGLNGRNQATTVTWFLQQHCLCSLYHNVSDAINCSLRMEVKGGNPHAVLSLYSHHPTQTQTHTHCSFPSTKSKNTSVHKLIQIDTLRNHQPSLSANSQTLIIRILQEDAVRISIILFKIRAVL